jgi:hypothetical protein
MNPIMIYTLPRTRASAILYCCRNPIVKNEVFSKFNLDDDNEWHTVLHKITDPKTVLKIHGTHIARHKKIQQWYEHAISQSVYNVFVVERPDRLNTFLSFIVASKFGFSKREEIDPFYFTVTDYDIQLIRNELVSYLLFYPTYGQVIDIDSMPEEYFNIDMLRYENQHSYLKYQYITNYTWTVEQIQLILDEFNDSWNYKIKMLSENKINDI